MAVVLVGAILRVAAYLAARSLWLDEAMLANNILGRSFAALLGPLGESQNAPWLFLFGERAAAVTLGPTELALRLIPLVAGVAVPWMVWLAARRLAQEPTALVATAIAALSPLLLYYSNEVKPYATDALLTAAFVAATLRAIDRAEERGPWIVLTVLGVVGLLASFPVMFVLGAVWCALIASPAVRASMNGRRMLVMGPVVWAVTFAFPYFFVIRRAASDAFLMTSLQHQFLVPWKASALPSLWRFWQEVTIEVFLGREAVTPVPQVAIAVMCALVFALCVTGISEIKRRRGAAGLILILGPIVLALAASTVRAYPLSVRVWTFSTPLWALLVAAGVTSVARRLRPAAEMPLSAVLTMGLLLAAVLDAQLCLTNPTLKRSHIRPMIRSLQEAQRSTGDAIYVMPRATPQWLFYTTAWDTAPAPVPRDSASQWIEQRTCEPKGGKPATGCQMLGGHSSVTFAEVSGFSGQADTVWANHEARRLRAAAHPCAWLLMHLPYPGETPALARAVEVAGGRVDDGLDHPQHPTRDGATKAFRICFADNRSVE